MIFILVFLVFSAACEAIEVQCIERHQMFYHTRFISYCEPKNHLKIYEKNTKANVKFNESEEILGIRFYKQEIFYVPQFHQELTESFRLLSITASNLKEIKSETLVNFLNLEVLELSGNEIIYLEENLLKNNTKLKTFDISSNRIYAIHPTVFESLQKLLYFNIRDNICSSLVYENSTIIKNGMNNLKLNCSSDLHSVLSQNYKIIEELGRKNSELLQKLNYLKSKMVSLEIIVILALGCIVVALVLYIIHKNCRNSSNQRFHSKVSDKTDMFEETSSICFSSTAGGLDDYPMRRAASHLNINHQKQSAYAEDGLPEYADPIMFTKKDIERRLNSSGQNYLNSEVDPSSNYLNCGPFGDNAVIKYQNYPLEQSTENLGLKSTLNIQDVGNKKRIVRQNSNQHGNLPKGSFPSGSIGYGELKTRNINLTKFNQKYIDFSSK